MRVTESYRREIEDNIIRLANKGVKVRHMAKMIGCSASTVQRYANALAAKGLIKWDKKRKTGNATPVATPTTQPSNTKSRRTHAETRKVRGQIVTLKRKGWSNLRIAKKIGSTEKYVVQSLYRETQKVFTSATKQVTPAQPKTVKVKRVVKSKTKPKITAKQQAALRKAISLKKYGKLLCDFGDAATALGNFILGKK